MVLFFPFYFLGFFAVYFNVLILRLSRVIMPTLHISYNSFFFRILQDSLLKPTCFYKEYYLFFCHYILPLFLSFLNSLQCLQFKSRHLFLVCNLKGKTFSLSSLNIVLAVDFSQMTFIKFRKFLSVLVSMAAITNCHKLCCLHNTNLFSYSMGAQSLKSVTLGQMKRCVEALRENPFS